MNSVVLDACQGSLDVTMFFSTYWKFDRLSSLPRLFKAIERLATNFRLPLTSEKASCSFLLTEEDCTNVFFKGEVVFAHCSLKCCHKWIGTLLECCAALSLPCILNLDYSLVKAFVGKIACLKLFSASTIL